MPKKVAKPTNTRKKRRFFQSVKGMHDILPQDQWLWDKVRDEVRDISCYYNFLRIDTPIVEDVEIFEKGVGPATDIVEKQMYFIKGKNEVLRPEGTAPVVRAYLEHGLSHLGQPVKLHYMAPMFRHEQPQEGRFRQFHQAGFEIFSAESDPVYDVQVILVCYRLLEALKINNLSIQLNTIGCKSCRVTYRRKLSDYYRNKELCRDCQRRVGKNTLRLLDCKNKNCVELVIKGAPTILDTLCRPCNEHFKSVLEYLEELGLPYSLNNHLVRGLDYYNQTVFEIFSEGFKSALAGGGRYDYLVEMLGGRKTAAVGAAIGLDRVVKLMKDQGVKPPAKCKPKVFVIHIGELAKRKSLGLIERLKKARIQANEALGKTSLQAQLRQADKEKADLALIFGQKEAFEDSIIIRDLETGVQETVPLDKFIEKVRKALK